MIKICIIITILFHFSIYNWCLILFIFLSILIFIPLFYYLLGTTKSGKDVKSVKSRPCPDGIIVDDDNIIIIPENSPDKEAIQCYDTSLVTNMIGLFQYSDVNADLSGWDVSSVTEMAVSYQV